MGIRLREGEEFPYFETRGLPPEFVMAENRLCAVDSQGELQRDSEGNAILECMCGNVIRGRFDPAKPFFTARGSFWTNSTSELLAGTTEADRQARTRNRCHGEGYESVALIALRASGETFGLLQLNDRRGDDSRRGKISPSRTAGRQRGLGLAQRKSQAALEARARNLQRDMINALSAHIAVLDGLVRSGHPPRAFWISSPSARPDFGISSDYAPDGAKDGAIWCIRMNAKAMWDYFRNGGVWKAHSFDHQ